MPLAYHTNTPFQNCAFCYILLACIVSQPSPTRAAALDTGTPGHAQTAPERTKRQPQKRHTDRKDTETAPAAEPPQRSSPEAKRQKSQSQHDGSSGDKTAQQTLSPTRAAEIEPEPESQKRGTVDHEKRGNEEKTTVKRRFSPRLTERPADQPPEPAQHRQTRTAAETPPFSVPLLWSMRNQRRSTPVLTIRKAGTVHIFTTSPTPKIWLCTLFSTPLSFSPNHHLTNTPFINDIFPYKYKYPLLQTSLRKNALINAYSSSSWQHAKIHFHIFMLRNTP
ncbi:hypothetical protein HMPREF0995_01956 [Lachnospiraceae bacterium 7_1_58FAA]|nr:hypothetical protein HMPREF0995_01956 [Lachnospiraceae bacterium 7_1_58FAA]